MTEGKTVPRQLFKRPLFVNRSAEVSAFQQWHERAAAENRPLLVVISGGEGMGKTTLATHLAHQIAGHFPDGQLVYEVHGSAARSGVTADQVAAHWLQQLGVGEGDLPRQPAERIGMFRSRLAGKRMLMLLDDVHLVEQVRPLLADAPRSATIVTSRHRLEGLRIDEFEQLPLTGFDRDAATELLVRIAGPEVADLGAELVDKLRTVCEGLPLALSVAALRLGQPDEDPAEYIERLLHGQSLAALEQDGQRPVERVFDAMFDDLPGDLAHVYTTLSLLPGPDFGVAAAAALLEEDEVGVLRSLRRLAAVHALESLGSKRFRYHNLVREHAIGKAPDGRDSLRRQAIYWYWQRAVALDKTVSRRPPPDPVRDWYDQIPAAYDGEGAAARAWAEFAVEWPNLLAAARAAVESRDGDIGARFPIPLWFFGYQTGRHLALLDAFGTAFPLAGDDAELHWQLHRDLGALHEQLGDLDSAAGHAEQALRIAEEREHVLGVQSGTDWLAIICEARGELANATAWRQRSWETVAHLPAELRERAYAVLSMHIARVQLRLEDFDSAETAALRAIGYFDGTEEIANLARARETLGLTHRARERFAEAESLLTQVFGQYRELGMNAKAADIADSLAELADRRGAADEAEAFRRQAQRLREPDGH
ncbi:NB-ARC domain-containing protein [Amycolatopsis sp. YIM 10]|uniref:NB-ARC domain-containing protein n=1 Tax=Amycolatopsis sp. YIM 10 TaxID=2653857 RepID=UPI0012902AB3|nr:NB-ARC domain-containing protein [Amycolatopsis sp. YIM 10]QFU86617.1 Regulatory protein AfsR [Amycolatopsis sp. YIM 10]